MYTTKCEVCGKKFSNLNPAVANRSKGYHKRIAHNIPGAYSATGMRAQKQTEGVPERPVYDPALGSTENRRRYQAWYRATHKPQQRSVVKIVSPDLLNREPIPIQLSACPCCHATFWAVKGQ